MKTFCASIINQMANYLFLLIKYQFKNLINEMNCPVSKCKVNECKK